MELITGGCGIEVIAVNEVTIWRDDEQWANSDLCEVVGLYKCWMNYQLETRWERLPTTCAGRAVEPESTARIVILATIGACSQIDPLSPVDRTTKMMIYFYELSKITSKNSLPSKGFGGQRNQTSSTLYAKFSKFLFGPQQTPHPIKTMKCPW